MRRCPARGGTCRPRLHSSSTGFLVNVMKPISQWLRPLSIPCPRILAHLPARPLVAALAAIILIGLGTTPAAAATRTWKGGNGSNWMVVSNWVGNLRPEPGDSIVFPDGAQGPVVNDFPVDT